MSAHLYILLSLIILMPTSQAQLNIRSETGLAESSHRRPLPAEEAFPFSTTRLDPKTIELIFLPAKAHYLYQHRFSFYLKQLEFNKKTSLEAFLPEGIAKTDEFFGAVEVYYDELKILITLPEAIIEKSVILIEYQGCADWGFCYPSRSVAISIDTL